MYTPAHFAVTDLPTLHAFVREHGFAVVISNVEGVPFATHLPLMLEVTEDGDRLIGHLARNNPHWQAWQNSAALLIIFSGPHAFVSPTWYAGGVAVPTWNYMAVHAYGTARVLDNPAAALAALVEKYEPAPVPATIMPPEFVEKLSAHIVAFEITVTRWEGKFKLSQNRSAADQAGVVQQLEALGEAALAAAMRQAAAGNS